MPQERLTIGDWEVTERSLRRVVWFRGALAAGMTHCLEISFEMNPYQGNLQGCVRLTPSFFRQAEQSVVMVAVGSVGPDRTADCFCRVFHDADDCCNLHFEDEHEQIGLIELLSEQEFVTLKIYCADTHRFLGSIPFPNQDGITQMPARFRRLMQTLPSHPTRLQ